MKTIIKYDIDELNNMWSEEIQDIIVAVEKYLHELKTFKEVALLCEEA